MEEFKQITLNEWMEWKEDIRRKLQETAGNFVHIGFRLRQIRDSGMFDGCEDIFDFAYREYGLGKSTVSRFIAINERFSEGGYSLELKQEYKAIGSSKLAEMLTLTDAECTLITERTTVKEIRELKNFSRQQEPEPAADYHKPDGRQQELAQEYAYTPLQKCIIDYFSAAERREMLNRTMDMLAEAWHEQQWDKAESIMKEAAEVVNPGEYGTHKKGIVFLFLYDWNTGVKYKLLTEPEPVTKKWPEFLAEIYEVFKSEYGPDTWENFYGFQEAEKASPIEENQGFSGSVATSQQEKNIEPEEEENETEKAGPDMERDTCQKGRDLPEEPKTASLPEEQIPGQDSIMNHPEYLPESMQQETPCLEEVSVEEFKKELRIDAETMAEEIRSMFLGEKDQEIPIEVLREAREKTAQLLRVIDSLIQQEERP